MLSINRHSNAVSAARAFATERSADTTLLLVLGPTGVGKTALVQQLIADVSARGHRRCHAISVRDLTRDMVEAVRSNTFSELACRFGASDFVAIEDVSDLRGRPATLAELGRLIASWLGRGARVVCTVGCSLHTVSEFEERLPPPPVSRIVTLPKPTRHDMRAILTSLAATAALTVDGESLTDLAAWCDGDIRRAVGAIRQLQFEASASRARR